MKTKILSLLAVFIFIVCGATKAEDTGRDTPEGIRFDGKNGEPSSIAPGVHYNNSSSSGSDGRIARDSLLGIVLSPFFPSTKKQSQPTAQDRLNEQATLLNNQAVEAEKRNDWAAAVTGFQEALKYNPTDPIILKNLEGAQSWLRQQQAQQKQQQQNQDAVAKMQQIVQNFSQTLTPASSASGGLDFDNFQGGSKLQGTSANGQLDFQPVTAASAQPATVNPPARTELEFGDPMVVDGRNHGNLPSNIPKSVEDSIAKVFHDASPDAFERIRKGWQAVMTRDWKVADAYFKDALNHDPSNPQIIKFVKNFQDAMKTPVPTAKPAADPKVVSPQSSDMEFMNTMPPAKTAVQSRPPDRLQKIDAMLDEEFWRLTLEEIKRDQKSQPLQNPNPYNPLPK